MCKTCDGKYKFSFVEMITTGSSGKTSATGTLGVLLCMLCGILLIIAFGFFLFNLDHADQILELLDKVIIVLGIGAALLGTRKLTGIINSKHSNVIKTVEEIITEKDKSEANCDNEQTDNNYKPRHREKRED